MFNITVNISVVLTDLSTKTEEIEEIQSITDKCDFSYIDKYGSNVHIHIYKDGLCIDKKGKDYSLELHSYGDCYAKIETLEGIIKLDAKVVDFFTKDDILVMRYVIDETEREIKIIYRS